MPYNFPQFCVKFNETLRDDILLVKEQKTIWVFLDMMTSSDFFDDVIKNQHLFEQAMVSEPRHSKHIMYDLVA